jgi:hypothetical protein
LRRYNSADIVIRFNDGPTATFERFVGKKTTFRLINNQARRTFDPPSPFELFAVLLSSQNLF